MKKYECISCQFFTDHKPNFERHLKTKKHYDISTNISSNSSIIGKQKQDDIEDLKEYLKDLKEFVRMLDQKQTMSHQMIIAILKSQDEQIQNLKEKFNKLTNYLQFPMEECKIE